jgi:hypothetical protein
MTEHAVARLRFRWPRPPSDRQVFAALWMLYILFQVIWVATNAFDAVLLLWLIVMYGLLLTFWRNVYRAARLGVGWGSRPVSRFEWVSSILLWGVALTAELAR